MNHEKKRRGITNERHGEMNDAIRDMERIGNEWKDTNEERWCEDD